MEDNIQREGVDKFSLRGRVYKDLRDDIPQKSGLLPLYGITAYDRKAHSLNFNRVTDIIFPPAKL